MSDTLLTAIFDKIQHETMLGALGVDVVIGVPNDILDLYGKPQLYRDLLDLSVALKNQIITDKLRPHYSIVAINPLSITTLEGEVPFTTVIERWLEGEIDA